MSIERIEPERAKITLLTKEQAKKLPPETLRKDGWWWLRPPYYSYCASGVNYDGWAYDYHRSDVGHTDGGVVPAFQIDNLKAEFGDKVYVGKLLCTVVGDNLVLSDKIVCEHRFGEESNGWEKSELKAFIESEEFAERYILDNTKLKGLECEIERLKSTHSEQILQLNDVARWLIKHYRALAIQEFAEKLKGKLKAYTLDEAGYFVKMLIDADIDELVKELTKTEAES